MGKCFLHITLETMELILQKLLNEVARKSVFNRAKKKKKRIRKY